MSRPIWAGALVVDELAVPVTLHVAQDRDEITFKTLHRECGSPIKQKRSCAHCKTELAAGDTVKGHEFSPGQYVAPDAAGDVAGDAKEMVLGRFVDALAVSPLHYDRSYHLAPLEDAASEQAYGVLTAALEETGRAGLGTLTINGKEQVALVHAADDRLVLSTLYLARDLRPNPAEILTGPTAKEVTLAKRLIGKKKGAFTPDTLATAQSLLRASLDRKIAAGETIASPGVAVAPVDLEAALTASVRATSKRRRTKQQ